MSFAYIGSVYRLENSPWPHLWPSTDSDYVETVLTRASESIVFGLKSIKKSTKVVKKQWRICSGRRSRKFESCHLDQKGRTAHVAVLPFCLCVAFSAWLLLCNNASSVSPPGDRRACTAGAGRVNLRQRRTPCHLDHKKPWKHYRFQGFLLCLLRSF